MRETPGRERKYWDYGKALVNTIQGCEIPFSHKSHAVETDHKVVVSLGCKKRPGVVTLGRPAGLLYLKHQWGGPRMSTEGLAPTKHSHGRGGAGRSGGSRCPVDHQGPIGRGNLESFSLKYLNVAEEPQTATR